MSLAADKVKGRVIRITLDVTLTPPDTGEVGDTRAAWDLGIGIVDDISALLYIICKNEGFKVDIERKNTVY
jgi:hypothetical protein